MAVKITWPSADKSWWGLPFLARAARLLAEVASFFRCISPSVMDIIGHGDIRAQS